MPLPHPRQFARRAAGLFVAQLGAAGLVLLGNVATARALSPAQLGGLTAAVAGFWLTTLVVGLGTPTALAAEVARRLPAPLHAGALLAQATRLALLLGGVGGAVLLAVWGRAVAPLAVAVPLALLGQLLGCALLGGGHARAFRTLQLVPALAAATFGGACLWAAQPTLAWWAISATQACTVLAATQMVRRAARAHGPAATPGAFAAADAADVAANPTPAAALVWWRADAALLRAGAPVVASQLLVNLGLRGDFLLLAAYVQAPAVACYGVAKQVVERLALVAQATAPLAFAATAAAPSRADEGLTPLVCRLNAAVTLLAALALAAAVPLLLPALFGPAYAEAVPLVWIMLPGAALANVGHVLAQDLTARGRAADVLRCCALGLACNFAAFAWLTPNHGVRGAACATALAAGVEAAAKGAAFAYRTGSPVAGLWLLRRHDWTALRTRQGAT